MVVQDSISFAAPSQLRLHMVADGQGNALIAVLNAFNQPIGNMHHLAIPISELDDFTSGRSDKAIARADGAFCEFTMGEDIDHKTYKVDAEEPEKWHKLLDFVIREEFHELIAGLKAPVSNDGPELV